MLPRSTFFTSAVLGTWLAVSAMGQAQAAIIMSDAFNETGTPPATGQFLLDSTIPNAVGIGGYTNANLWYKFQGWTMDSAARGRAGENGGNLTLSVNNRDGAGIQTFRTPDLNFFTRGLQVMLRGVKFTGPAYPGYQSLKVTLTPGDEIMAPGNHIAFMLDGGHYFSLTRYQWAVTPDNMYLMPGTNLMQDISDVDLRINDTRYEIVFYWNGGGIYYCGNHGLQLQAANGIKWQSPGGEVGVNRLGLAVSYSGDHTASANAAQVQIDSIAVTDWVTPPVAQSMCSVPTPQ
ncbi:MAG: hypothetical protein AABY83_13105 [Pseudomonadota bacterium]